MKSFDAEAEAIRPTIQSVADKVGVSASLVSLALNGKAGVSAARRAEITQAAESLGYLPNPAARALRTGESAVFGLVVRNSQNPLFVDILGGMQADAAKTGHVVVALDSGYSVARERLYIRNLVARRVEGLAIAPIGDANVVNEWQRLMPGSPTVLINSDGMPYPKAMHVSPDSRAAVELAFSHLWKLGHRRIAFLCAPEGLMSDSGRLEVFIDLCCKHNVRPHLLQTKLEFESLVAETRLLLQSGRAPSALIVNSDYAAHAVYVACRSVGLRVGTGLSVVGHDDLLTSSLLDPPLTTLRVDRRNLGREIFARLIGTSSGDHEEPVSLIERGSTAPV